MKNIHIIPTDKPSRLFNCFGKLEIGDYVATRENLQVTNQHIYITFEEEIKEGDWWYCSITNSVSNAFSGDKTLKGLPHNKAKKIVLTTDQDLIKDGVQAIDNEFLEWFVKNPSCENVNVIVHGKKKLFESDLLAYYKIIIPKEEPNKTHYLDELPNMDKEVLAKMWESAIPKLEPKQETIEEAAERMYKQYYDGFGEPIWDEGKLFHRKEGFIEGAKWQAGRMYSEEEVESLLHKFMQHRHPDWHGWSTTKWFEQFKKK
jgi:hypothetical protein